MVPLWRACALLLLFALSTGGRAQAEAVVDIPTAKRLALVLVNRGQPAAGRQILLELAARHPDDAEILITLSRAERNLGNYSAAIARGRAAYRAAGTPALRYLAARVTAEALASDDKHTRAQFWLRRAGQNAPDARVEAAIRRDYRYVRSRNPLSFSFGGSIVPTDNANDAPTSNEIVIGGLVFTDPTAQPIPGVEFNLSAAASYRLPATETRQMQITFSYDARRVRLGAEAATIDPTLQDEDFSFSRVTLGWSGRFRQVGQPGVWDISARVFADWNAQARSQNGQALSVGYGFPIADDQQLRIGGEVERLDRLDRPIRSSTTYRLTADWSRALANRDRLSLHLAFSDSQSDSFAVAHDAAQIRVGYHLAKPVMGAQLGLSAGYRRALFDEPLYGPEPRRDDAISLSASATFADWDVYGFAPVLELRHERVRSNVSRFDTSSTLLSLSFRSTY